MGSNSIQRLTVNFSGKVHRAKHQGRDYLVAPMTLINPGVLNGSKGPLFYPPDEVKRSPRRWNGVPIVVYHPHRLGQPVSATEPGILDAQGIGVVRNATSNGKLRAEGWFDVQKIRKVNSGVYQRLLRNEPIEISTGLFTDNEDKTGTFNGRPYTAVARNYRPDHLAVLPDQVGACSVADGCGVLVNKGNIMLRDKLAALLSNKKIQQRGVLDQAEKEALAGEQEVDEENCSDEENCTDEKNCDVISNQSNADGISKKADTSHAVALKTDRPEDHAEAAKDALQAAAAHDLIAGEAESKLKDGNLEASRKYGKMWQEHLSKSEEDNGETMVDVQNTLVDKLTLLISNWGGPSQQQGPPEQGPPQRPRMPLQQGPSQAPPGGVPPGQPSIDPQVWLAKQLAMLISRYQKMSAGDGGNVMPPPRDRDLPNQQEGGPPMAKDVELTNAERETVVDGLIANESCCWEESDREVLNTMNDTTFAKLHRQMELVANAEMSDVLGKGGKKSVLDEDDDDDVDVEEEPTKKGNSQADGKVSPIGDLDPKEKGGPANNVLSVRDRRDLAFARRYRMQQRERHVKVITDNVNNNFTVRQLATMDDGVLANLAALAQEPVVNGELSMDESYHPSFFGAQGSSVMNVDAGADEKPLQLGRIDFKELATNNGQK